MSRTHRLELDDQTLREWDATVLDSGPDGIVLDRSAFYPGGGGQPPDHGVLLWGGVQTRIVDVRKGDELYLLPLDGDTIFGSVRRTGRLVVVHEDSLTGGWGAEIAARAADECLSYLEGPIKRVASKDAPAPAAPVLEQAVLPQVADIVAAVREAVA